MDLTEFANRQPPVPWSGDYKIPWDEPGFSRRMLDEHLDQSHDRASHRREVIERQAAFLHERVLGEAAGRILDVGCGPGIHTAAFAALGHSCTGVDFSPAAIEHARREDTASEYRLEDVRESDFGSGYDLVLMSYGEFNAFGPEEARELLERMRDAAFPGGTVVLEAQALSAISNAGSRPATWRAVPKSVFGDDPHLWLEEHFWFEDELCAVSRYFVVDGSNDIVAHTNTLQGYREHEYIEMLQMMGFRRIGRFPSLTDDPGLFYLVAGT